MLNGYHLSIMRLNIFAVLLVLIKSGSRQKNTALEGYTIARDLLKPFSFRYGALERNRCPGKMLQGVMA